MKGYQIGKPFYQANIWVKNGVGDPLLLEEFTTKREAVNCIKNFKKSYSGENELDCYVVHFDENEYSEYSFNVE
jgi:hypothetical protein